MLFSSTKRRNIVKGYVKGILTFAKNTGKNFGKNRSKNVSNKYSHKGLNHTKQSATDALKTTSKRAIQETAEATCDLIGNKIADKITRVSKASPKNNLKTNEEETLREKIYNTATKTKNIDD